MNPSNILLFPKKAVLLFAALTIAALSVVFPQSTSGLNTNTPFAIEEKLNLLGPPASHYQQGPGYGMPILFDDN